LILRQAACLAQFPHPDSDYIKLSGHAPPTVIDVMRPLRVRVTASGWFA
jgi:hypothetical protein